MSPYFYGDEFKEDKMGGVCSKHERDEPCIRNFIQKLVNGKDYRQEVEICGRCSLFLVV
jgi:hypothetical protein